MKLLRYGARGHEQPGVLDSAGQIRSLAGNSLRSSMTSPHKF
jgi:hypothetical protein